VKAVSTIHRRPESRAFGRQSERRATRQPELARYRRPIRRYPTRANGTRRRLDGASRDVKSTRVLQHDPKETARRRHAPEKSGGVQGLLPPAGGRVWPGTPAQAKRASVKCADDSLVAPTVVKCPSRPSRPRGETTSDDSTTPIKRVEWSSETRAKLAGRTFLYHLTATLKSYRVFYELAALAILADTFRDKEKTSVAKEISDLLKSSKTPSVR